MISVLMLQEFHLAVKFDKIEEKYYQLFQGFSMVKNDNIRIIKFNLTVAQFLFFICPRHMNYFLLV